jgi:hypothetical protein
VALRAPLDQSTLSNIRAQVLRTHHLKAVKLPTFLRECDTVPSNSFRMGSIATLLRLSGLGLINRASHLRRTTDVRSYKRRQIRRIITA